MSDPSTARAAEQTSSGDALLGTDRQRPRGKRIQRRGSWQPNRGQTRPSFAGHDGRIGVGSGAGEPVARRRRPQDGACEVRIDGRQFKLRMATTSTPDDGIDALLHLGRSQFDLILSDLNTPNLDGFKLLETTKQKKLQTPIKKDLFLLRVKNLIGQ
jgi:CheY-like chemotaxis protein